jgi:hypothetical protein
MSILHVYIFWTVRIGTFSQVAREKGQTHHCHPKRLYLRQRLSPERTQQLLLLQALCVPLAVEDIKHEMALGGVLEKAN